MTPDADPKDLRAAAQAECRRLEEMLAHRGMLDTAHRLIRARDAIAAQSTANDEASISELQRRIGECEGAHESGARAIAQNVELLAKVAALTKDAERVSDSMGLLAEAAPMSDERIDEIANSILTADPVQWWRQLARAIASELRAPSKPLE